MNKPANISAFIIGQTYPLRRGRGHAATITAIEPDPLHNPLSDTSPLRLWGVVTGPSYDAPTPMSWMMNGKSGLGYDHSNDLVAPLPAHLAGLQSFFNALEATLTPPPVDGRRAA